MKRVTIGALLAAVLIPGAAVAADMPMAPKAPFAAPMAAPAPSWGGLYIGVHGGFGGDKFRYPFTVGGVGGEATLNSSGFFGGGQIGYDLQLAPSWILGIEADIAWSDIEGKASITAGGVTASAGSTLEYFGTVRGRGGFLITPAALLYVTGGWAYGHVDNSLRAGAVRRTIGHDKSGWTVGGGLEYALFPWVSVKAEYLYLDLGRDRITSGAVGGVPFTISEHTTAHTVKVGLNFRLAVGKGVGKGPL